MTFDTKTAHLLKVKSIGAVSETATLTTESRNLGLAPYLAMDAQAVTGYSDGASIETSDYITDGSVSPLNGAHLHGSASGFIGNSLGFYDGASALNGFQSFNSVANDDYLTLEYANSRAEVVAFPEASVQFYVARITSNNAPIHLGWFNNTSHYFWARPQVGAIDFAFRTSFTAGEFYVPGASISTTSTDAHIFCAIHDPNLTFDGVNSQIVMVDNEVKGSRFNATPADETTFARQRFMTGGSSTSVRIGEYRMYDQGLTEAKVTEIYNELSVKWGLT